MAKGLYTLSCGMAVTGRILRYNCLLETLLCDRRANGERRVYIVLRDGCDRQNIEGQLSFRAIVV
jgi:hypothetical protein